MSSVPHIGGAVKPPVIQVEHVSMAYRLYEKPIDMLKEALFGSVNHDTFWAVRDVSLSVHEGDRIGILGPNGAGKSTLLQVIAGNLTPTAGRVKVQGRISSLLSLVPAWNGEESGVENIKFNLLLQGVPEHRIPELTESIADFTELGPFIDRPVKTYSSGMSARLSFAIATAVDPEILIIDEVLGTGDGYFASKASARMLDFCSRGRVLIFVSHALAAIHQFCNSAIWMEDGEVRMRGSVDKVVSAYEGDYRRAEDETLRLGNRERAGSRRKRISEGRVLSAGRAYFRISQAEGVEFNAQHLVEAIDVRVGDGEEFSVPLLADSAGGESDGPRFERIASQWQRAQTIKGVTGRMLGHRGGRDHGGEFSIPRSVFGSQTEVAISIRYCSPTPEPMSVDVLDPASATWSSLGEVSISSVGALQTLRVCGTIPAYSTAAVQGDRAEARRVIDSADASQPDGKALGSAGNLAFGAGVRKARGYSGNRLGIKGGDVALIDRNDPDANVDPDQQDGEEIRGVREVEIESVEVLVENDPLSYVKERCPFRVRVRVNFLREVARADVALYLKRQDGVHAFWQSSGLDGHNLHNALGVYDVLFDFSSNLLGAGVYYLSIAVGNGWDYAGNWPYSEVFRRKHNAAMLTIYEELPVVNFGVANYRVPVTVKPIARLDGATGRV